jgi:RNA polymerase sigma factor (sigma-70 family)
VSEEKEKIVTSQAENVEKARDIFQQHGEFIRGVINYKVKDEDSADDIYQNLFISLVSSPIRSDVQDMRSFLYRTIINEASDYQMQTRRYKGRLERFRKNYAENLNYSINKKDTGDAFIEEEHIVKTFESVEKQLPVRWAKIIRMKYKDGYSSKEIAEKMHISDSSVRTYISWGLKRARKILGERKGGPNG